MLELVTFLFSIAFAVVALTLQFIYLFTLLSDKRVRRMMRSFLNDPALWDRGQAVRYVKKFFNSSE